MFTPFTEQNFDTLQRKNSSAQRVSEVSGVPVEKSFTPDELRDAVTFGNVRAFYYANEDEFPMEERVKALEHDPLFPLKCRAFRKISRVHEATFFKWIEGLAMTDVDDSALSDADLSTDLSTSVAASFTCDGSFTDAFLTERIYPEQLSADVTLGKYSLGRKKSESGVQEPQAKRRLVFSNLLNKGPREVKAKGKSSSTSPFRNDGFQAMAKVALLVESCVDSSAFHRDGRPKSRRKHMRRALLSMGITSCSALLKYSLHDLQREPALKIFSVHQLERMYRFAQVSVRVQEEDGHDASSKNCATIASIVEYHQKRRTLSSMLSSLHIGSVRGKHEPQVSVAFLAGFVFAFATTAGLAWSLGNSAAGMKSSSTSEQNASACQDAVDVDAAEEDKNNNSQQ